MKELEQALQHYREHFQQVKDDLPGQEIPWLAELREQAIHEFLHQGFPTRKHEEWKYSSTLSLAKQTFTAQKSEATLANGLPKQFDLFQEQCQQMVFLDGCFVPALSQIKALPKGVVLTSLSDAIETYPEHVADYLKQTKRQRQTFTALNTAFMQDGYFLLLPEGCVIEQPIHVLYLTTHGEQFINLRNVCIAQANSQATIVEHYVGQCSEAYFNNTLSQINAQVSAHIQHYKIIQEGDAGFHIGTVKATQQQHSSVHSYSFAFTGAWTRSDTEITFEQEHAECTLDGLYVVNNAQHIDHHTRIDHNKAHCTSREFYKGILTDKARGVFNGKVFVAQDAQKTNADQSNRNLLLSKQAEIDTKPQLEIYADDVRCTHGAAVGQLDDKALFYLQSRGINKDDARQLLVHAFANEVIDRVELPMLRDRLTQLVEQQLAMESGL